MGGYSPQSIAGDNNGPDGNPCYLDSIDGGITFEQCLQYKLDGLLDGHYDDDCWPDSAFKRFDLEFDVRIPEQKASIPLDGSPLGEFTMNMELQELDFFDIGANIVMEMPADPTEQNFLQDLQVVPTEAMFEIILKNTIQLPIEMLMEFKGYNL